MKFIRSMLARAAAMIRGHESGEADVRAEMEAHLAMATEENIRRGMSPEEARRQAMLASGGISQAAESVHEQRGLPWVEGIMADTRFAMRHFRRTPLSTITMIVVLSLGIGTNVVLFTILNSLATMPAPGIERDASMVRIRGIMQQKQGGLEPRLLSWPEVEEYATRTDLFSGVAAYADETASIELGAGNDESVTAALTYITPNYFDILGVHALLGSPPAGADATRLTTAPTAMISYAMWQKYFGSARDAIGRTVRINGTTLQITGVAPQRFVGADNSNQMTVWVPLAAYPVMQKRTTAVFMSSDSLFLHGAAHLREGVTTKAATQAVAALAARTTATRSDSIAGSADVVPMLSSNERVSQRADLLTSGIASGGFALLVLLITCTNVSALMVGLAVARRKEIGVRLSLGAPRMRLIRQLLTETVIHALVAAALGLFVTNAAIQLLGANIVGMQLVVDWRVTIATCSIAILTGVLFGVSPALHATRVSLGEVLKSSSTSVVATRSRLQRMLVVAQITLTQPLLVGLGVVIVSMVADMTGHTPVAVMQQVAEIELNTWSGRSSNEERAARIAAAVDRIAAMPGVVTAVPMQMGMKRARITAFPPCFS